MDHCDLILLFALQLKSFQVKYPLLDVNEDEFIEYFYRPIFNSAIEVDAYFKPKEQTVELEGWSIKRKRLTAISESNYLYTWKNVWKDLNTIIFIDKNTFNLEEFFKKCTDPYILTNPGSIYHKTAWNFARKKAVDINAIGLYITNQNTGKVGGVKCNSITIIGSEDEIKNAFRSAIDNCRVSNYYQEFNTTSKPTRSFKIIFDKKTCKQNGKYFNEGYGERIWSAFRLGFNKNGYGQLVYSAVNDGGNYINILLYTSQLEEGLFFLRKVLKETLFAPENTIIKENTWPDTSYNYSFCLGEKWSFINSKTI